MILILIKGPATAELERALEHQPGRLDPGKVEFSFASTWLNHTNIKFM